jgi:hypothetical protein
MHYSIDRCPRETWREERIAAMIMLVSSLTLISTAGGVTMALIRLTTLSVVLVALVVIATPVLAKGPPRVTGGGETVITTLVLTDGSTMATELPTHLGFAAIGGPNGAHGQFECLINGPGFTGQFMNIHGDVQWLEVDGDTASFGGDSNFGPYSVVVTDGAQPAISLRWTVPFGPGAVGTEETLIHGTIRIRD